MGCFLGGVKVAGDVSRSLMSSLVSIYVVLYGFHVGFNVKWPFMVLNSRVTWVGCSRVTR